MTLNDYLRAPEHVQRQFDRKQAREIEEALALERRAEEELADDAVAQSVKAERELVRLIHDEPPVETLRVPKASWDEAWTKRARRPAPKPGDPAPYDRDRDPLFDLDLRECWEQLTGEVPNAAARVRCPNPDHDDRWPDCRVYANGFNCFACGATGSIIDLGSLLYGIEPRGAGFFRIRERLLAELGMSEEAAA